MNVSRRVRVAVGGLLLGGMVLVIMIWLLLGSHPAFPSWRSYQAGELIFLYPDREQPLLNAELPYYAARQEAEFQEIIEALQIDRTQLPEIRIYLYSDASDITIPQRVGSDLGSSLVIPAIYGQNLKPLLAERLVTAVWGAPASELLRAGLRTYLGADRIGSNEFHSQVAALLPDGDLGRHRLEQQGGSSHSSWFPYRVAAPEPSKEKAWLLPEKFPSVLRLIRLEAQGEALPIETEVAAASLVQYLIEERGGISLFRKLWSLGLSRVQEVYGLAPETLDQQWRTFLKDRFEDLLWHPFAYYLRGRALAAVGHFEAALHFLEHSLEMSAERFHLAHAHPRPMQEDPLIQEALVPLSLLLFEIGRIQFDLGHWEEAQRSFQEVEATQQRIPGEHYRVFQELLDGVLPQIPLYRERARAYAQAEWQSEATGDLLVHFPPSLQAEARKIAARAQKVYKEWIHTASVPAKALPDRVILFLYESPEQLSTILDQSPQESRNKENAARGVIHLVLGSPLDRLSLVVSIRRGEHSSSEGVNERTQGKN